MHILSFFDVVILLWFVVHHNPIILIIVINPMEQNPSWETNRWHASKEDTSLLWNLLTPYPKRDVSNLHPPTLLI
jgi:hypothetical protein